MARGVNKVILVGNLGDDPEVRYTQSGMAVANLSIATTSVRKDRDGNTQEKTEWHRVTVWGKTAEAAGEYLRKGRQVYVEGRIEYGSYEKDGVKHYTTDIVCDDLQFLGGGRDDDGQQRGQSQQRQGNQQQRSGGNQPQRGGGGGGSRGGAPQRERPQPAMAGGGGFGDDNDFRDDDIPFLTARSLY